MTVECIMIEIATTCKAKYFTHAEEVEVSVSLKIVLWLKGKLQRLDLSHFMLIHTRTPYTFCALFW